MDRRAFLLFTAAGVASPDSTLVKLVRSTGADRPPDTAPSAKSGDGAFDDWRAGFIQRQTALGWSPELLHRQLDALTPDATVVRLDSNQPEFDKPIGDYIRGAVSADRVAAAQSRLAAAAWLPAIQARYGVPAPILVAIWCMESAFGTQQGDMDVIRCLATLAAQGRRRAWAEGELLAALQMIRDGLASRGQMRGSWAGAMGQTQFMPDAYLASAVDADADGRRDIWGSAPDALASAANLLAKAGWTPGLGAQAEVIVPPGFDYGLAEGPRQTPGNWAAIGVRRAGGRGFDRTDADAPAGLIVPAGADGPAFLIFANHEVIKRYNNSTAYALAIGLLADRMAGGPPLQASWPNDPPLSRADRAGAQAALAQLGFDPGAADGVIGVNTRAAVRAFQKSRGLTADGYLTAPLAHRLMAEALMSPPATQPAATGN